MTNETQWIERFRRFVMWPVLHRIRGTARVSHHGFRLLIDMHDRVIGHELYVGREWEPYVISTFPLLGLEGTTAIDVGANIGVHTLEMSKATGTAGRVIAFEPESRSFELLVRNLSLNGVTNVSAENVALGDHPGRARLAEHPWNLGDHQILLESESSSRPVQEVQLATLDDFCLRLGPNTVSMIKIDVQGYEAQVLRGAEATIDSNPDVWILLEIPSIRSRQLTPSRVLVRWLVERGFHGIELHTDRLISLLAPTEYDLLFESDIHVLLSRNERKLDDVVQTIRETRMRANAL